MTKMTRKYKIPREEATEQSIENDDPKKSIHQSSIENTNSYWIPKRFIFSIIGFFASTLAVTLNTNLSLAIVSMVDRSNVSIIQAKTSNECIANLQIDSDIQVQKLAIRHGEFLWSPQTEGLVLGSLYYGQLFGFMPSGRLAEVFGGKKTIIAFMLLSSLCTFISPFAARTSVYVFAACRFLVGVGTAPIVPVFFYLISRWIPDSERSFNASFILAGFGVGGFVSFLTAGVLCSSNIFGGWPSVFYLGGTLGFSWCLACYIFVSEKPEDHPTISQRELQHIRENMGSTKQKQIKRIPWKSIVTSRPFWSLAIGYFGQFWILGFYCTVLALYMGTILKIDSRQNGELSCLPHLIRGLFACLCGIPIDRALRKGYITKEFARKGATTINSLCAGLGFIGIIFIGCDASWNTVIFVAGGLCGDFITFGVCLAALDIAPNLTGTVSGILSFIGVIPFFLIPAIVGFCTKYQRSMAEWRVVYYISIGVIITTTLIYVLFGSSEPQDWGSSDEEVVTDKNNAQQTKKTVGEPVVNKAVII